MEQQRDQRDGARFGDLFRVTEQMQNDAVDWYRRNGVPKAMRHLPQRQLAVAHRACGGDWRRCVFDDRDQSITIYNYPMWVPESEG